MAVMLAVYTVAVLVVAVAAAPASDQLSFIGRGTDTLATALLKDYIGEDNVVFSPLGLNTLLAIFAEGARGGTRDEIAAALSFPPDLPSIRQGYQAVLRRLSEKYQDNIPEMKNWFYVYKNYTVELELIDVLREYYLTEVKFVDKPEDFIAKKKVKVPAGLQGKPTEHLIDVDKEVEGVIQSSVSGAPHKSDGEEANSGQQPALFDPKTERPNKQDNTAQTDKHEKTEKEQAATNVEADQKEKSTDEMMLAMQRSLVNDVDDMSGVTDSAVKINKNGSSSQMVVFNGLYYKGDWETQFVKLPADDSYPFYKANNDQVFVKTLHANGVFGTADCPELESRAVELKYVGGRYSLLLVVPYERDALPQLVHKLAQQPVSRIYARLSEKLLDVCLPTFQITSITKPVSSAKKGGVAEINKLFRPDTANLSGISKDEGLYVEEVVQLVTFMADSNYTEANFLTASVASTRSEALDKFAVNQPFLFFLRDNIDGIVVVSGKVTDPTPTEDQFTKHSLRNTVHKVIQ